jgi:murein DD-endopeptidase
MLPPSLRDRISGRTLGVVILAASLLANLLLFSRSPSMSDDGEDGLDPTGAPIPEVSLAAIPAEQVAPLPEPKSGVAEGGTHRFQASVQSSLSATFQTAPGTSPAALSAVFTRIFVWDVDVRRSVQPGDTLSVLYDQPADPCPERTRRKAEGESLGATPPECRAGEPVVLAARLKNRTRKDADATRELSAYRWQANGDRFPSYWNELGYEVPRRLIDGPLADYDQILSLIKDRPTHAGMDFRAPVGTPVVTPRAGVVTRTNWNQRANGNCVEVRFTDGTLAKFLHLNENLVKVGQSVSAGTAIGKVGNTGISYGPHLHYQLEKSGSVIDPVDYHGVFRRQLPVAAMEAFEAARKDLDAQLDARLAER